MSTRIHHRAPSKSSAPTVHLSQRVPVAHRLTRTATHRHRHRHSQAQPHRDTHRHRLKRTGESSTHAHTQTRTHTTRAHIPVVACCVAASKDVRERAEEAVFVQRLEHRVPGHEHKQEHINAATHTSSHSLVSLAPATLASDACTGAAAASITSHHTEHTEHTQQTHSARMRFWTSKTGSSPA